MAGESQQVPESKPDPSVLTTDQMLLAVSNLEKLVKAWLDTEHKLCDEQFNSVRTQLDLGERQRIEQKKDTKDAVDAALAAAKEAVKEQTTASERAINKSELATAENVKQQGATFTLAISNVSQGLNDLKERVAEIAAEKRGAVEVSTNQRLNLGAVVGVFAAFVSVLAVIASVVIALTLR